MTKFKVTWLEDRSPDGLLAEVRRVATQVQGRLTKEFFNKHARINSSTLEQQFGSWSEATRQAGLNDAVPIYTDEAVLTDLRRVATLTHSGALTIRAYKKNGGCFSHSHITRRFQTWASALEAAGLGDRYAGTIITDRMLSKASLSRSLSDSEILNQIRQTAARLGKNCISAVEIQENSGITQDLMSNRFGSAVNAIKRAGLEPAFRGKYEESELFDNLRSVWIHYGRPPTVVEMGRPPSIVAADAYLRRFTRWREALRVFVERANSEIDDELEVSEQDDVSLSLSVDMDNNLSNEPKAEALRDGLPILRIPPENRKQPSKGLRFKILDRDSFTCQLCGDSKQVNTECVLHIDHIIPFANGGKTTEYNLRTLCAQCNIGRGNRYTD